MISREWIFILLSVECFFMVLVFMVIFLLELEFIMAAWVLVLGRVGFSSLLFCKFIRMEIILNVWDDF